MDFNEIYGQMQEFYAPPPGVYTPQEAAERTKARTDFALAGFATGLGGALVGPPRMTALSAVASAFTSGALLYLTRDSGRVWNFLFASGITSNLVTAVKAAIDPESVQPLLPDRMGRTRNRAVVNQARRRMIRARKDRLRAPSVSLHGGAGGMRPVSLHGGAGGMRPVSLHGGAGGMRLRPEPPKPMNATLAFHPHHDSVAYRLPRTTSV